MRHTLLVVTVVLSACTQPDARPASETTSVHDTATPPPLHEDAVAWDAVRNRLVLFGGTRVDSAAPGGYQNIGDTYEWDGSAWRMIAGTTAPDARTAHTMAFDPETRLLTLASGASGSWGDGESIRQLNDVWTYDGQWTRSGEAPVAFNVRMLPAGNRLLLLGHAGDFKLSNGPSADELRRVTIWQRQGNAWLVADSSGPRTEAPPRPAFDAARNAIVLPIFDGPDAGVWEWNEGWRHIKPATSPSKRYRPITTFDARLGAIVLFGGNAESGELFNELWTWDGARWLEVPADSTRRPPPRYDGTLIFDPTKQRLLLVGGMGADNHMQRDMWSFTADGWRRLH